MNIAEYIPCGIENAISQDELSIRTGLDKRTLRNRIYGVRCDGAVICSTCDGDGGGYYIPLTPAEAYPYVQMQKSRIDSAEKALASALQYASNEWH